MDYDHPLKEIPFTSWLICLLVLTAFLTLTSCSTNQTASSEPEKVIPRIITFMISSDTDSSFTPCGCQSGKWGGLPRRGSIFAGIEESVDWDVLHIDAGNVVGRAIGYNQELKDDYIFRSYQLLDYDFVNVGYNELRLQADNILNAGEQYGIPWSSANIYPPGAYPELPQNSLPLNIGTSESEAASEDTTPSASTDAETLFEPYIIVEPENSPGFRIGFFGIVLEPPSRLEQYQSRFSYEPYLDAITRTRNHLRDAEHVDLVVLLHDINNYDNLDTDLLFEGIDIVVGAHQQLGRSPNAFINELNPFYRAGTSSAGLSDNGTEDESPTSQPVLEPLQLPLLVPKGAASGKILQRLDITFNDESEIVDYYIEDITADEDIMDDPRFDEIAAGYDTEVLSVDLNSRIITRFGGSTACERCHPGYTDVWREHGHGHFSSYATIEDNGSLNDRECTRCHALGFMDEPRLLLYSLIDPEFQNVDCGGCHPDGGAHIRLQERLAGITPSTREETQDDDVMKLPILEINCRLCHTGRWGVDFDFPTALSESAEICNAVTPMFVLPEEQP